MVAEEASKMIEDLVSFVCDSGTPPGLDGDENDLLRFKTEVARFAGLIYNQGIKTAPRAVQSTVRLRAVQKALQSFPLVCTMKKTSYTRRDGTEGTSNALSIISK